MVRKRRSVWPMLLWLCLGGPLALAGWLAWYVQAPLSDGAGAVEFTITRGSSTRSAVRQIVAAGLPVSEWRFVLLAKLLGRVSNIKAGSYQVDASISPVELLDKLTNGDTQQAELSIIEGWNLRQIRASIRANTAFKQDTAALSDLELARRLSPDLTSLEGWLFPDTYLFAKGSSEEEVLLRAFHAMQRHLAEVWRARAAGLPYASPYEVLIAASLVEKETGRASDRPLIAAVFANRLRAGMRLQTDSTVIYALGAEFDGNLRRQDLLRDHPFNTYARTGLPPTPIAMPGLAALAAAVQPADSDALYFVARGDGSSEFSRTLEAHNRAVRRYQLGNR